MSVPYIPSRDADLSLFLVNFAALLTAAPGTYGVSAPNALTNQTNVDNFVDALALATDPSTRTTPTIAAKDLAKANAVAFARTLAMQVQAYPAITPELLADLGLTVRDTGRTPVPPPATYPILGVVSTAMHSAVVSVADQSTPNARRRPTGLAGCEMYVSFGAAAPSTIAGMSYVGLQTKSAVNWDLGSQNVGQRAWIIGN